MKIVFWAVLNVILPEPNKNGCFDKFSLFVPPPPWHFHLITISVKNQARMTMKIVGSYSRGFTILLDKVHLRSSSQTFSACGTHFMFTMMT